MNGGPGASKLIVAFLARGMAHEVATALHERFGIDAFHYAHGRSEGVMQAIATGDLVEVDFLSVVVDAARADETFAFIFETGDMDRPGGGMLVQMPLAKAAAKPVPAPQPDPG